MPAATCGVLHIYIYVHMVYDRAHPYAMETWQGAMRARRSRLYMV